MLNSRFISLKGLDTFRDKILVDSILQQNIAVPVAAGTVPESHITYYTRSGSGEGSDPYVYSVASPQPTSAVPANTYWTLSSGSPDDVTRAPSVYGMTHYVNTQIDTAVSPIDSTIEDTLIPSIESKVTSVEFDNTNKKITYYKTVGSTKTKIADTMTFASSGAASLTASSGTLTISSTDTKNTAGSTAEQGTSDLYIIGALSQSANPQTYSNINAKIDKDGYLYSHGTKVDFTGYATTSYVDQEIALAIGSAIAASY